MNDDVLDDLREDIKEYLLSEIATLIKRDWRNVYFGAVPYLRAMGQLDFIDQNYGMDSGYSIVRYFLSNANSWRGHIARVVKAELKERLKDE